MGPVDNFFRKNLQYNLYCFCKYKVQRLKLPPTPFLVSMHLNGDRKHVLQDISLVRIVLIGSQLIQNVIKMILIYNVLHFKSKGNFSNKWLHVLQLLVLLCQLPLSNTYAQIIEKYYGFQPGGVVILSSCKNTDYVILAGSYLPNGDGITYTQNTKSQGAIFCCNGNGDTIWTKLEGNPDSIKKFENDVADFGDGTFFLIGENYSMSNSSLGYYLERYQYSDGTKLLQTNFTDSTHYHPERLKKFTDGSLLLCGYAEYSNIDKPFFLLLDSLGNEIWTIVLNHNYNYYYFAATSEVIEYADSFKVLVPKNYYYPNIITIKKDGTFLSRDSLGICPTSMTTLAFDTLLMNSGYTILGNSVLPFSVNGDFFEFKYSNFSYYDTLHYGLLSTDVFTSFSKENNGNKIISGQSGGNITGPGDFDAIAYCVDSIGNSLWYVLIGDSTYEDNFIKTYKTGTSSYISVGNTIRNTASGVLKHAYFVKYDTLDVVSNIEPNSHFTRNEHLMVYPNPAKEELYIKLNGYSQKGETESEYTLFDAKGNSVLIGLLPMNATTSLTVSNLVAGMYCLVVRNGDTIISRKVIIE
jgi:hypothetical protein